MQSMYAWSTEYVWFRTGTESTGTILVELFYFLFLGRWINQLGMNSWSPAEDYRYICIMQCTYFSETLPLQHFAEMHPVRGKQKNKKQKQ